MKSSFKTLAGSVTAPRGFSAAGVYCDIKRLGTGKGSDKGQKRDLALILSEVPAAAAGVFTTNQVRAAPVQVCLDRIRRGRAQAIVANSGNANACTGRQGQADAVRMTEIAAERLELDPRLVLVCSTGRIGVPLPMANVKRGIVEASNRLGDGAEHSRHAAEAVMTSDTRPKEMAVELSLRRRKVRIGGLCKGAGMIQPGMSLTGRKPPARPLHATMLCFLTTDAAAEPSFLRAVLADAVAHSFNRITVDGDMSTNDSVILLANGRAGNPILRQSDRDAAGPFREALQYVTLELAKMIVRDGEGVSRFVTVRVKGARSVREADAAVRAVGNSALVKTSWCGGDPNWGRILDALGYSTAKVVEERIDLGYSRPNDRQIHFALEQGQPSGTSVQLLRQVVGEREFDLHIHLNLGRAEATLYAADLTEAYVEFNKGE